MLPFAILLQMNATLSCRDDFPIFSQYTQQYKKPLVYLDSAATSQKPQSVIDAMSTSLSTTNANVHRASYTLGAIANDHFESARATIARFVGVADPSRIVFTKNATEAVNVVARGFIESSCQAGNRIAATRMEHHANFVPWQQLAKKHNMVFDTIAITPEGTLCEESFDAVLQRGPKLIALTHCSNVLGTINPVKRLIEKAHTHGAAVMIDGTQAVPHMSVNVDELGADFYVFTGHKMVGPTGVGVLTGKKQRLEALPPFLFGGDMIDTVTIADATFAALPNRLEAGTLPIAEAIGLAAACAYLEKVGFHQIEQHEKRLLSQLLDGLAAMPAVQLYGTSDLNMRAGICSFTVKGAHPHDISMVLDAAGICVRSGNHCAQPLFCELGIEGCLRASIYLYNNEADIEALLTSMHKAIRLFAR